MASRKHKAKNRPVQAEDLAPGLNDLFVARKSTRLLALWPTIEEKLAQGVSHAQILKFLNKKGLALTERTYKSYLYRFRKHGREQRQAANPASIAVATRDLSRPTKILPSSRQPTKAMTDRESRTEDTTSKKSGAGRRPATFEFDPTGISPDLLK